MFGKKKKEQEILEESKQEYVTEDGEAAKPSEEEIKEAEELEAKIEEKKEQKKERKYAFINAQFILKMVAFAILFGLFFWLLFDKGSRGTIIITTSGALIGILCLARIVWLCMDKKSSKRFKLVTLIEILCDAAAAVFLLIAGVKYQSGDKDTKGFISFVEKNYRYFVGGVLYARGVLHYFAVTMFKTKSTFMNYVVNMAFITVGTWFIADKRMTVSNLGMVIVVLIAISCVYLGGDSLYAYIKFKNGNGSGEKRIKKEKAKEEEKSPEVIENAIIEPEVETNDSINVN